MAKAQGIDGNKAPQGSSHSDLGFGGRVGKKVKRLINRDGSFNVIQKNFRWADAHPFQTMIAMPWWKFWTLVFGIYIAINSLFASLYVAVGVEYLSGITLGTWADNWSAAFFFSVQTFTTVGYGAMSPMNPLTNCLASLEALVGLLSVALATGLMYGRFTRPSARILFSEKALIVPWKDGNDALMFRIVNGRTNQLIELETQTSFSWIDRKGAKPVRRFAELKLQHNKVNFFPLNWTLVHVIDKSSPLYGLNCKDLERDAVEFMIIIKAFDDTFSQNVYVRSSYQFDEIIWNAKFEPMFYFDDEGDVIIDRDLLGAYKRLD